MQYRSQAGSSRGKILSSSRRVNLDVQMDRVDHYQSHLEKCGVCKKNIRIGCKKCGCGLRVTIALKSGLALTDILLIFN